MRILFSIVLASFFLSSCAVFVDRPWVKYPMNVSPDKSYYLGGGEGGALVYVWKCHEGQRIVIFQNQSGLYRSPAQKEVTACGTLTNFEVERKHLLVPKEGDLKSPPTYQFVSRTF